MYMDNHGIVHDKIAFIPDDAVIEEAFTVRVWKVAEDGYELVGVTEPQDDFPDEDRLKWTISYFKGTYATVEKIFYIAKVPFAEGD